MRVLQNSTFVEAHPSNFNTTTRATASIKYIVIHYTSNINDTARNNALYFRDTVTQSSAHYFVSETSIYQSVKDNHAAYAVGLGARKQPYFQWPDMWKKITNSNSISIELCGSKYSREASDLTKQTAAMLCADLLEKYGLTPSAVYRHYDVTGKNCPAWAVEDRFKWLEFRLLVNQYFYGTGDEDKLLNTEENYKVFKEFMDRWLKEQAEIPADWEADAMAHCDARGIIKDGRPKSFVKRGELAAVLQRLNV